MYEWFIVDTGEVFYVGKGKNDRYKQLKNNKFFLDMYKTHKCDVRIVEDKLTEKEAFQKEKELIKYYRENTTFRLTNMTDGGEGSSGYKANDETRRKISLASKHMWENENFRKSIIKLRNDKNSVYQSQEFKNKISELVKGSLNPNYGNRWNEKQKEHLSKVRKEMHIAEGINNPNAKAIICLEIGEKFNMISEAQNKYNVKSISSFSIALKNKNRVAANYHWRYFDERLLDVNYRFIELLNALSESQKYPICCPQTKETFNSRKDFLRNKKIGIKKFLKIYSQHNKYLINENEYMYVNDYLSRFI